MPFCAKDGNFRTNPHFFRAECLFFRKIVYICRHDATSSRKINIATTHINHSFKGKADMKEPNMQENEIVLYQPNDAIHLEVRMVNESVWLTQQQIAMLFGVKQPAISKHLNNIFNLDYSWELNIPLCLFV